jgi:hypothetical protein
MSPPSAAAAAAPAVHPRRVAPGRPLTVTPRPRRVSGPARARPAVRPGRSGSARHPGVVLGLIEAVNRVSQHRLLDRLIRGRSWIALVAFALIGIVTLQLGLLKLNAGIGRTLARETSLQRENAALSIENSEVAAGDLVESGAARLGMEMVPVAALRFLTARPHTDASSGAAALSAPVTSTSSPGSESSGAESSTSAAGAEGSAAQSSEPQASSASSGSETEEAKSSESPAPSAGAESSGGESSGGESSAAAPASSSPSAPAEASGGTQAGSSGR